jgi:hypothetical protein
MKIATAAIAAAVLAATAFGPLMAAGAKLPPYAEALRCGGLTEAAASTGDPSSDAGRAAFDAAIFWGLAASEAARKAKLPAARFTSDQKDAAALARGQLEARSAAAWAELDACLKRVPPVR